MLIKEYYKNKMLFVNTHNDTLAITITVFAMNRRKHPIRDFCNKYLHCFPVNNYQQISTWHRGSAHQLCVRKVQLLLQLKIILQVLPGPLGESQVQFQIFDIQQAEVDQKGQPPKGHALECFHRSVRAFVPEISVALDGEEFRNFDQGLTLFFGGQTVGHEPLGTVELLFVHGYVQVGVCVLFREISMVFTRFAWYLQLFIS